MSIFRRPGLADVAFRRGAHHYATLQTTDCLPADGSHPSGMAVGEDRLRDRLQARLRDRLRDNPTRTKSMLQTMIDGIRVDARDHIEPTFRVPAVRVDCGYMEPAGLEPATSCLQNAPEDIWKGADLEGLYW